MPLVLVLELLVPAPLLELVPAPVPPLLVFVPAPVFVPPPIFVLELLPAPPVLVL